MLEGVQAAMRGVNSERNIIMGNSDEPDNATKSGQEKELSARYNY